MFFFPLSIFGVVSGSKLFRTETPDPFPGPPSDFHLGLEVIAANSEVIGRSLEDDLFFFFGGGKHLSQEKKILLSILILFDYDPYTKHISV